MMNDDLILKTNNLIEELVKNPNDERIIKCLKGICKNKNTSKELRREIKINLDFYTKYNKKHNNRKDGE